MDKRYEYRIIRETGQVRWIARGNPGSERRDRSVRPFLFSPRESIMAETKEGIPRMIGEKGAAGTRSILAFNHGGDRGAESDSRRRR